MLVRSMLLATLFFSLTTFSARAVAQVPEESAPSDTVAAEKSPAQAEFEQAFRQWKDTLKEIRSVQVEYQAAEPQQQEALQERFKSLLDQAKDLVPKLKEAAENAYATAPNDNKDVADFLMSVFQNELNKDDYEEALRVGKLLIDNQASIPKLEVYTGVAAFNVNQYDLAEEYFQAGRNEIKAPGPNASPFEQRMMKSAAMAFSALDHYRKLWATEQAIREGEAKDDNLPRVKLETSKGDIVIELFENEAPNTTANFLDLVEKGFYNELTFHRVIRGFMAQGGCPKGDGSGGPGYAIRCECDQPNARKHFRGTLSMAHAGPDTGGSQFFLTFVPTPHLDGKHTAFGRIIEGLDVLSELQAEPNPQKPADKILKATVLRKRDHEYKVHKLPARQ